MEKKPESKKFLAPIQALSVLQGEKEFYLFTISAKKLLQVAYTSERTQYNREGIQRGLRTDRLRAIGKFLTANGSTPLLLPNAIIVSLSSKSYYKDGCLYIHECPAGEAFVIDGQHRLWAFDPKYSGEVDLNVVVTAFIDLDDSNKASIFRSINGNQRKINPSLVYDLIPMLRDKETVTFEDERCQDLVALLNEETPDSPWKDRISMVGGGNRIISQASFISALKKLFKKGHLFSSTGQDFFEQRLQHDLLLAYFKAIQGSYSVQWDNKAFFLCKYVGVSALLNLLEDIVTDLRKKDIPVSDKDGLCIDKETFTPYMKKLEQFSFSTAEEKKKGITYVGEGGIRELTRRVISLVFPS
ncbi:MAG: DGQHR domain-containing protein [Desulfurellaceae bacterium]|nr:DGQHR domain-containing protein [Desulfurellaceae bacterium]